MSGEVDSIEAQMVIRRLDKALQKLQYSYTGYTPSFKKCQDLSVIHIPGYDPIGGEKVIKTAARS